MKELAAGHDGPPIPAPKRAYFQQRLRNRFFELLLSKFAEQQARGLTKAKLARRIGKTPEVVNRWLGAPSNLTIDSLSDLLLGISAEELEMGSSSLLNRPPTNSRHPTDADADELFGRKKTPAAPTSGETRLRIWGDRYSDPKQVA
jgi:transcriptional regulator with XRE-family HTH domain